MAEIKAEPISDGKACKLGAVKTTSFCWDLANGDTAIPIEVAAYADRTVQFSGTADGGTLVLEGSIDGDTWFTLSDALGTPITGTSLLKLITENPRYIRPELTGGGASTNLKVCITGRAC